MDPLTGLLQLLLIGFALYWLTLVAYTMWALTHPHRQTYASALARNLPGDPGELDEPLRFTEQTIDGARGQLAVWDIIGRNPDGPLVVMTHGWGSSRQGALKRIGPLADAASRVIAWDLPGHGDSDGVTRLGADEHTDCLRVIEHFSDALTPVVLYGWSMGAGVSLAAARIAQRSHPLGAVLCESPYRLPQTPARNVIRLKGVPYRLNLRPAIAMLGGFFGIGSAWRGFDRAPIAAQVSSPLLILHGDADPVCPLDDARAIVEHAADARLEIIEGGGHNNLWADHVHMERMSEAIGAFLGEALKTPSRDEAPARP